MLHKVRLLLINDGMALAQDKLLKLFDSLRGQEFDQLLVFFLEGLDRHIFVLQMVAWLWLIQSQELALLHDFDWDFDCEDG